MLASLSMTRFCVYVCLREINHSIGVQWKQGRERDYRRQVITMLPRRAN